MSLDKTSRVKRKTRSTAAKVLFIHTRSANARVNLETLVANGKACMAFGQIEWENSTWDVEASESARKRGHKQVREYLNFTQHKVEADGKGRKGLPFEKVFAEPIKAIIRLRRAAGDQCASNHRQVINAFRYLYDTLEGVNFDICKATPRHFDAAAQVVLGREGPVSADGRIGHLEEIASIFDLNGLTPTPIAWKCSSRTRGVYNRRRIVGDEDEAGISPKMAREVIIQGLMELWHRVPVTETTDRLGVGLSLVLALTGLRIGEVLSLPAEGLRVEAGERFFIYFPEKRALPRKKWLMTEAGHFLEQVFAELLAITADARQVARALSDSNGQLVIEGIDLTQPVLAGRAVAKAIGHVERSLYRFLDSRRIPYYGTGVNITIRSDDLVNGLKARLFKGPVAAVKNSSETVELHECLSCVFENQFHSSRPILKFSPCPMTDQQLRSFLATTKTTKSLFERYDIREADGAPHRVRSHAFRHWLNSLLDEGGLSDAEQAEYFGRKDPLNNRAYQHKSRAERVKRARQALMEGSMLGPVADDIFGVPVSEAEVIIAARVNAVHLVPGGACFHSFSQSPCPRHLECQSGCGDFHWQTDDVVQLKELQKQKHILEIALDAARTELGDETYGADAWFAHQTKKLDMVIKQIRSMTPPT